MGTPTRVTTGTERIERGQIDAPRPHILAALGCCLTMSSYSRRGSVICSRGIWEDSLFQDRLMIDGSTIVNSNQLDQFGQGKGGKK